MNRIHQDSWRCIARTTILPLFVLSLLSGCNEAERVLTEKPETFGTITVDTPEIVSREHLVNDRFRHEAWLIKGLKLLDDAAFGRQGDVLTQFNERVASFLGDDPGMQATTLDESRQTGNPVGNTGLPQTETFPDREQRILSVTPIEEFRERLAYLDEMRTEMNETQFDDRDHFDGNTLYRLKFHATIVPGSNTTAWARIGVRLLGPASTAVEDEVGEPAPRGSSVVQTDVDSSSLAAGPALEFPISAEQGRNRTSPIVQIRLYLDWIESLRQRLNNELRNQIQGFAKSRLTDDEIAEILSSARSHHAYLEEEQVQQLDRVSSLEDAARLLIDVNELDTSNPQQGVSILIANNLMKKYVAQNGRSDEKSGSLKSYVALSAINDGGTVRIDVQPVVEELSVLPTDFKKSKSFGHEYLRCRKPYEEIEFKEKTYSICAKDAELLRRQENLAFTNLEMSIYDVYGKNNKKTDRKRQSTWLEIETGLRNFSTAFPNRSPVFANVVTPKESAQRLSSRANILAGPSPDSAPIANFHQAQPSTAIERPEGPRIPPQIIERAPLVVGMAKQSGEDDTEFGWMIGPSIVSEPNQEIAHRQIPSRQTLSAILSVPAWWQHADVEIRSSWLNENGAVAENATENGEDVIAFKIRLPGDPAAITEFLQRRAKRTGPVVFSHLMPPVLLQSGERTSVLIPGRNLWRGTVVTIGSMRADQISVLPNMEGIIAEFPSITHPQNGGTTARADEEEALRMVVWTSDGVVEIDPKLVRMETQKPAGAP